MSQRDPIDPATRQPEVLTRAELADVTRVMREAGVEIVGPLAAQQMTGGKSNLTALLSDDVNQWVLRTPPRAGRTPSAHDVAREYLIISCLSGTAVPVPTPVTLCTEEAILGGPFAIAEFVPGTTIQSREQLDGLDDATLDDVMDRLLETLAALHRVNFEAVGLGSLGRPDGYAQRQLRRWSGQWEIVGPEELRSAARDVADRLDAKLPHQRLCSIVHGDYRIDNTILTLDSEHLGERPLVAAVVDWELSTLGDPVADVAMMCAYRNSGFDLILGSAGAWSSPRLPDVSAMAARYEETGGVELADWQFQLALAHYKIAVVAAGIDHRSRAGGSRDGAADSARGAVDFYLELAGREIRGA